MLLPVWWEGRKALQFVKIFYSSISSLMEQNCPGLIWSNARKVGL